MKNKKQAAEVNKVVNGVIEEYRKGSPETDPLGMYTGLSMTSENSASQGHYNSVTENGAPNPEDKRPTQDADDL